MSRNGDWDTNRSQTVIAPDARNSHNEFTREIRSSCRTSFGSVRGSHLWVNFNLDCAKSSAANPSVVQANTISARPG